jgi:hypothetical protein
MWANVNGARAAKANGDSFQSLGCASGVDGCSGSVNTDYATDGYFYTISVKQSMPSLTVQVYDPVWTNVGLTCTSNFASSTTAENSFVPAADAGTRYLSGSSRPECTGDNIYGGSQVMNTSFTVRSPSANAWDPLSYPVVCQRTFAGYNGTLFDALDQYTTGTTPRPTYRADIAEGFRRWVTLCTIPNPQLGDYLVQVRSNIGGAFDSANTGNRFSLRAWGADNNAIAISGREKMGIFSNAPGATTEFYLARIPSGSAGQTLRVSLFDVGDSNQNGTIKIIPPAGGSYAGCVAAGPVSGNLTDCTFQVFAGSPSPNNGKWQHVSVPIPSGYSCNDADATACWVKLQYQYGVSSAPTDVTTWTARLEGDPVRLVE